MKLYTFLIFILLLPPLVYGQTAAQEWYDKGVKLKGQKKAGEAIIAFKEATKLKTGFKEAWYEMGWCQNDIKDYRGAINSLNKARALWTGEAKIHFELGYAFEKTPNIDSAIHHYNQAVQISDTYSSAYKQLGVIYFNKNDHQAAITNFLKYEESAKNPINDYLYWYRKGYVQNALKQYEPAKLSLNKSLEFKTDYASTYLELGFACKNLKLDDDAIAAYTKAMDLAPKSHIPLNGIGEVYRDNKKDMNEAMNWYKKALAINPDERKANFGMGYCLNNLTNHVEAISYLQKAVRQEPTYTAAYVELGYSQYKTGDSTAALESFNKALSLNPKNENARYHATLVYLGQSNKLMAQKMVDELKDLNSRYVTDLQERVDKL